MRTALASLLIGWSSIGLAANAEAVRQAKIIAQSDPVRWAARLGGTVSQTFAVAAAFGISLEGSCIPAEDWRASEGLHRWMPENEMFLAQSLLEVASPAELERLSAWSTRADVSVAFSAPTDWEALSCLLTDRTSKAEEQLEAALGPDRRAALDDLLKSLDGASSIQKLVNDPAFFWTAVHCHIPTGGDEPLC